MTKILHLIRHGESVANQKGVYQGQSYNTGLTKKGFSQAQAVAKILTQSPASCIYSSPLTRTLTTAQIIQKHTNLNIITDHRLLEINHGTWEGKTPKDFNLPEKKLYQKWRQNPWGVKMIKGEQLQDVVDRCHHFIDSLNPGQYIVSTHDLVIRVIACFSTRLDYQHLWRFYLDNCGITTISFDPLRLVSLNQNFHLNHHKSLLNRQVL